MTDITNKPTTAGRVVVGFDGSDGALRAVLHAARQAQDRQLGLTVIMALAHLDPSWPRTARAVKADPGYLDAVRSKGGDQLTDLGRQVRAEYPELDIELALVGQNPAGALIQASEDAALVVVGARGRTAEHRQPVLGGVSTQVTAHSQCPVIVVPEVSKDAWAGPVVIGLQDAPDSLAAGAAAVAEAERMGRPLLAMYAWDVAPELGDMGALARLDPVKTQQDLDTMLKELLHPLMEGHPDVSVQRRVVQGSARTALVEASKSASLVVIGTRGLGGFAGMLLGSISRSVTREAACPVMVVRQHA